MKKRNLMVALMCSLVLLIGAVPVNAQESAVNKSDVSSSIIPRGVYSEYKWFDCGGGAGAVVQILKNDTGSKVYIMGFNLSETSGDIGIPGDSISLTSKVYDNGVYGVITLHYKDFGVSKSRTYTVYP